MYRDMAEGSNSDLDVPSSPTLRSSCLRNKSLLKQLTSRSVSFPEDEARIVTGYLEPPNPWEHAESANKDSVISQYKKSCERHGTKPITSVLKQLQGYDLCNGERMKLLSLKGEALTVANCEPLEEIFKRVQLVKIDLESTNLDDESSVVMFDMIEYYEAAVQLNVSNNNNIGGRGWQACSRMLKRAKCLELLECRGTQLSEQYMTVLSRALRIGTQLQVLKLDNCQLTGRPMVTLVAALKLNSVLRELHLGENGLNIHDALQLAALLKHNITLQLLDVSNNCLEDIGVGHLLDGLWDQHPLAGSGTGLNMLVLWNNNISNESSHKIANTLVKVRSLEVLNIGSNRVGNEMLEVCREALCESKTIMRLGMQSTQLTCSGAETLASIIATNNSLQRIDIRDNDIHCEGLEAISNAMKCNKCLTRLDVDGPSLKTTYLSDDELKRYTELWDEIRIKCHENEANEKEQEALERLKVGMRKISLTCNTLKLGIDSPDMMRSSRLSPLVSPHSTRLRSPAPSPIPSPVTSPSPIRTRFQVSRVSEEDGSSGENVPVVTPPVTPPLSTTSRFRVTVIEQHESSRPQPSPSDTKPQGMVSRARKLSSWVNPAQLLTESKTVEKILGLFPWSRGSQQDLLNNNSGNDGGGGGGTWPPQQPPAVVQQSDQQPNSQHSTSTPSLVHTS